MSSSSSIVRFLVNLFSASAGTKVPVVTTSSLPKNSVFLDRCVQFSSVGPLSLSEGDGGEEGKNEPPPLKRNSSALNVAKLLKKTISKHNLHATSSELSEARISNHHTGLNGHVSFSHENTNGDTHASTEQESLNSDHHAESVNQKHNRKKDSCSLATVTEETNGDGETEERYWKVLMLNCSRKIQKMVGQA